MSKYKHMINQIVCAWLSKWKKRPVRILETHQGEGDATEKYRCYGCVISFEIDRETYNKVRRRFQDAFSLDACLEEGQDLLELAESYQMGAEYPVILPLYPTDSRLAIPQLQQCKYKFDLIDVDPYGSPREFIPDVLDLLNDKSILLVTTGEMHSIRFRPQDVMDTYEIQANQRLKPTRTFFRKDNILIVGAWIVQNGLRKSIGLYPIFVYDYYTGRSGVQRIGFFVRQQINLSERIKLKQELVDDPILGTKLLCCFRKKAGENAQLVWRFCDSDPKEQVEEVIIKRLEYLAEGG